MNDTLYKNARLKSIHEKENILNIMHKAFWIQREETNYFLEQDAVKMGVAHPKTNKCKNMEQCIDKQFM